MARRRGRPRKRSDWGSLTEVSPGVWRIRYWASCGEDGYRRRSKTVRGTRKEAGDVMAQLRLEHTEDAPCPTVRECWERWYRPDRERMVEDGDLAPASLEQYSSTWKVHVSPRWGDVPCDAVRPLAVQQWLMGMRRSAASASQLLLRQLLDYAVRYECIASNPLDAKYLLPSKSTTATRDDGVWSPEGVCEVWRACHGTWIEAAVLLGAFGGLRVGESLAVRSEDVTKRTVDGVTVALVEVKAQIDAHARKVDRTKNEWSMRTAVLAGRPAERLLELAAASESGWLTTDGLGGHARQDLTRIEFERTLRRAGVEVHLLKNLRKSWETNSRWTLKMPPWITERMMGHVGEGVTGRHYDRPEADEFAEALAHAWKANPYADSLPWMPEKSPELITS